MILSGANSYGVTAVSEGKLVVANSSALAGSSLMVGAGAGLLFGSPLEATPAALIAGARRSLNAGHSVQRGKRNGERASSTPGVREPPLISPPAAKVPASSSATPTTARSAAGDLLWLRASNSSFNFDQHPKQFPTVQALDALFAHYDR